MENTLSFIAGVFTMLVLIFIYMTVIGLILSVIIAITPYVIVVMASMVAYQIILKP